jgi:UDP-N-acetylglucosamine--N-acetylmuramyl-(pentapeptide) pyrophosphoryl-undecaprenol N-acetylglucosamine transferase
MIQSFLHVFFIAPDLIFSKGGFGSFPPAIAGWILQTPIFMHESDVTPGASNRLISKFAKKIFVSFPHTEYFPLSKIIRVGNPIRKELLEESREEAEDVFNVTNEKPIILVLGGSQGAQKINDEILEVLPQMLKDFELIHQTGKKNFKQIEAESKTIVPQELEKYYHPFAFFKEQELKKAYLLANLVVSRAGAGSIFEIAAFGKPSILVPIAKAAQNHQIKNAYNYSETGASQVLEESNFSSNFFLEKLRILFSNPDDLEKMSQEAKNFSKISAAKDIAKNIVDYLFY